MKIKNKIRKFLYKKNLFLGEPLVNDIFISKKYIESFLPNNPLIVDCGAYDGSDSIELASINGVKVYSFEPIPNVYDKLKSQTFSYKNIKTFKLALADFNGPAKMFVSTGESFGSSSLLKPKDHLRDHPEVYFYEELEVNCSTLDGWARQYGISRIDMLWLDMQGYELPMLQASMVILPTVKVIHTEVSLKETYEKVKQYAILKEFLVKQGFKVKLEAIPFGYDMGNVLFIRE